MKRSRKSLVALLLVLCMAMTFVVPATFAATETIVFDFGHGASAAVEYRGAAATMPESPILLRGNATGTNAPTNDAYLLNCNSGRGFNIAGSIAAFRSNASKWWFAVELCDVKAGVYDLNILVKLKEASSNGGGIANVYFVKDQDYEAAFASTNMADVFAAVTGETNTGNYALVDELVNNEKVVASFTLGPDPEVSSWKKEGVSFPANDDYVMIFRTKEKGAIDLSGLQMTREVADPAVAKIGDTAYPTLAAALEAAASGDEIKLVDNVADAGSFTVPSGVTLDLNGKNLTADNINVAGTLKDSASAGVLTANITCTNGNRGWLPLTNGSGKTLFELKAASLGVAEKTEDTAKFGFNVHFVNADAYAKAGNTTIKVLMTWDGGSASATASETFVSSWASTNSGNGKAIGVTVNGLTGVANFKLQPVVEVNGVTVNLDAIALS